MLEILIPHLKKILVWITLKRIIMLGLASIVWIFSVTMFENRAQLYDALQNRAISPRETTSLKLSEDIAKKIRSTLDVHPEVNFIMVVGASIAMNQRELIYWYTNTPQIEIEIQDFVKINGRLGTLLGHDEETNAAIIRAINGEFACYDNAKSLNIPALNPLTKKVCRVSIPPYYGQFSGYLTFGVSKDITQEQLAVLRHDAVEITTELYFENLKRLKK